MSIRTILVDDEDLARRGLRVRLERSEDIDVIGECANGREAIEAIGRLSPDLVFLDVQMPEASGFEVLQAIGPHALPYVIFVTAYDQYAVHAFEVHALDYLLKPVDDRRLEAALSQARAALSSRRDGALGRQVAQAIASWGPASTAAGPRWGTDRVAIPTGDRLVVVRIADINWVGAAGNYVSLHTEKKAWLLRETIATMDQRLASHGFARIHRSTLVNLDRLLELRTLGSGDFAVVLRDGAELKLSRNYRASLWKLLAGNSAAAK
ncbi:MAG TPA: response regulator [Steroidobacteraceae bacterium]|jgi:two-component system LytT family response regulator